MDFYVKHSRLGWHTTDRFERVKVTDSTPFPTRKAAMAFIDSFKQTATPKEYDALHILKKGVKASGPKAGKVVNEKVWEYSFDLGVVVYDKTIDRAVLHKAVVEARKVKKAEKAVRVPKIKKAHPTQPPVV